MLLGETLQSAIQSLTDEQVPSPRMNAEVLLMFVLGEHRAYLYSHPERELTPDEQARYDEALRERATGRPAQYITGHQEFWGLDFVVTPAVLIPRPETEHLVETVLELVREQHEQLPSKLCLVDVGTGSGCVALALANELPFAQVYATDISPDALEIATANAARLQLADRVQFLCCDVLEPTGPPPVHKVLHDLDFVVSNPPYVAYSEADKVQRSVKEFEPQTAVFAGEHGLDVIVRLIAQSHTALRSGGWLAMEIGYSMRDQVLGLLGAALWAETRVVPDLQGIPRVIAARRK
jgi:release factor glutamine methyltransferase